MKTVPLGQMVTVGHCLANPQRTNWLAEIVTVTESPGVSVPEPGDTLMTLFGSLATEADQLTGPPYALR